MQHLPTFTMLATLESVVQRCWFGTDLPAPVEMDSPLSHVTEAQPCFGACSDGILKVHTLNVRASTMVSKASQVGKPGLRGEMAIQQETDTYSRTELCPI